jgi:hypothetical protein
MRIMAGVGDLVPRIGDGQAQVGYSMTKRSRGRVTLCAVCIMHKEIRSACFLVDLQNQGRWFISGLASKPLIIGSTILFLRNLVNRLVIALLGLSLL